MLFLLITNHISILYSPTFQVEVGKKLSIMGFGYIGLFTNILLEYGIISSHQITRDVTISKLKPLIGKETLKYLKTLAHETLEDIQSIPNISVAFEKDLKLKSSYRGKSWRDDILPAVLASDKDISNWLSTSLVGESFMFASKEEAKKHFIKYYSDFIKSLLAGLEEIQGESALEYMTNINKYEKGTKIREMFRERARKIFGQVNKIGLRSNVSNEAKVTLKNDSYCKDILLLSKDSLYDSLCLMTLTDNEEHDGSLCSGDSGGPVVAEIKGDPTVVAIQRAVSASYPIKCQCACR